MQKFWVNLKKYWLILISVILPYILFFLPVLSMVYTNEMEKIVYNYSFYNMINLTQEVFFTILMILFITFSAINLILFVLFMIDNYKINLYSIVLKKIVLINNIILCVISLMMLGKTIYLCVTKGFSAGINYKNCFNVGTVILNVFMIGITLLLYKKFKRIN